MKMHVEDFNRDIESITKLYDVLKDVPASRRHSVLQYVLELLASDEKAYYQAQSAIRGRVADCLPLVKGKRDDGVDA